MVKTSLVVGAAGIAIEILHIGIQALLSSSAAAARSSSTIVSPSLERSRLAGVSGLTLLECRRVREERRRVPVGSDPLEREPELHALELRVVLGGGRRAPELAPDPLHLRLPVDPLEQRLLHQEVVRALVLRRHAPLVSPPERRGPPVGLEPRGQFVRGAGRVAARERDVLAGADGPDEQLRRGALRLSRRVENAKVEAHDSPSASSFERSMAAWIAFRNAARTPARSSSRIARIVVPPGDVTISRSSTGCIFSSRRSFAVPSIVWTTSCVDVSRPSPSRIPASIIASASRAKYAGPEPETARSEEHTSELQSRQYLVCRLLLEKKKKNSYSPTHSINKNNTPNL